MHFHKSGELIVSRIILELGTAFLKADYMVQIKKNNFPFVTNMRHTKWSTNIQLRLKHSFNWPYLVAYDYWPT